MPAIRLLTRAKRVIDRTRLSYHVGWANHHANRIESFERSHAAERSPRNQEWVRYDQAQEYKRHAQMLEVAAELLRRMAVYERKLGSSTKRIKKLLDESRKLAHEASESREKSLVKKPTNVNARS